MNYFVEVNFKSFAGAFLTTVGTCNGIPKSTDSDPHSIPNLRFLVVYALYLPVIFSELTGHIIRYGSQKLGRCANVAKITACTHCLRVW